MAVFTTDKECVLINLASKVLGEQDVPSSEVSVDELFVGEVVHTVSYLSAEVEEELRQVKRKIWHPTRERERERHFTIEHHKQTTH